MEDSLFTGYWLQKEHRLNQEGFFVVNDEHSQVQQEAIDSRQNQSR